MDTHYQRHALLRLAAAAALETYVNLTPWGAWTAAGQLPESVREALRDAATNPLRSQAQREVAQIVRAHLRRQPDPTPYPLFAEPPGSGTDCQSVLPAL